MHVRLTFLLLLPAISWAQSQPADTTYLRKNAVEIKVPEKLSDTVYRLLAPYPIIMFGEMHGTNESAPFVIGLANMFAAKGDSVQVGLEIQAASMSLFLNKKITPNVYRSDFFVRNPHPTGRESFAWASLISILNKNKMMRIFFYDTPDSTLTAAQRDSVMAENIKAQIAARPHWRTITLSGNYHNRNTHTAGMTSILRRTLKQKICSLNMEYKEGEANADFGKGLEKKALMGLPSIYNTVLPYEHYLILLKPKSGYEYDGFYYVRNITPANVMTTK